MTINEVMTYGTDGFTESEKKQEQERRLQIVQRINKLGDKIATCDILNRQRKARLVKQLATIKRDEVVWLRPVAWFLYD